MYICDMEELKLIWLITSVGHIAAYNEFFPYSNAPDYYPPQEREHFYEFFTTPLSSHIEGTNYNIPEELYTPDYRVEGTPYIAYPGASKIGIEAYRPFRLSPHYRQRIQWYHQWEMDNLGCSCTTVYRRTTLLAGCAVLTYKHILTTATSTLLILDRYKNVTRLEEILGAWYDTYENLNNSSYYFAPARISIHPKYVRAEDVNASHPLPCMYDLAVWECMYGLHGYSIMCSRAASSYWHYSSTISRLGDVGIVVGYQFMKAFRRKPMPWYKYGVRTREFVKPCPKSEWGWFNCVMGDWARLGMESGAPYHMRFGDSRQDGLAGILAFSLRLRSKQVVHYFTVLDTYPVLEYLYDAYLGRMEYVFLDDRFYNNKWYSASVKPWFWWNIDAIRSNGRPWQGYYGYKYPPFY